MGFRLSLELCKILVMKNVQRFAVALVVALSGFSSVVLGKFCYDSEKLVKLRKILEDLLICLFTILECQS